MNTLLSKKPETPKEAKSKYEMNLAEFPLAFLTTHIPKGIEALEYQDTITGKNGQKISRQWKIYPHAKYGFPTPSTQATIFELFQIWAQNNFESPIIQFGNIRELIKRRGLVYGDKKAYDRIKKDLNLLVGITIEAKNAFWDKERGAYVDKTFHLFNEVTFYRREGPRGQQPLPFAFIQASDVLWGSVDASALITLKHVDSEFFQSLTPIQQKLALYLGKMLYSATEHRRDALKLGRQLPILSKDYKDVKKQLTKACEGLLEKKFPYLTSYGYEKNRARTGENIFFHRKIIKAKAEKVSRKETDPKARASRPGGQNTAPASSTEAQELVCYFYQRLHGIKDAQVQPKEMAQAQELISTHGLAKARHIVDFAYQISQETNEKFKPAVFSGLSSLMTRALADYNQHEENQKRREKEKARQRERKRREEEAWERDEQLLAGLSSEEREQLFKEAKEDVLTETPLLRRDPDSIVVTESAKVKVIETLKERVQDTSSHPEMTQDT